MATYSSNTADPTQNPDQSNQNRSQNQGTGFTNINQILDANQGAGQKEGQKIGSGLSDQANSVRAGIQSAQSDFSNATQAGSQPANQAIQAGQGLQQQAGEDVNAYSTRLANGNQDYTQVGQNLANASYGGPMGISNAGQLQAQGANATALGRLAGTQGGQTQLLQSMVAAPGNYTSGQSALDTLLLGQGGQNAIQQGRQATIGSQQQAVNATGQAANEATALKSSIDTNRTNAIQALQNQLSGAGDQTSNNITGLETVAKNNASTFDTNAQRLQQLISGQNADGSPITSLSASDQALLQNMGQYGLQNNPFYSGDTNARNIALNSLSSTLSLNPGSSYYQGDQQKAAIDLANVLGQTDQANAIGANTFNTNVYSQDPNVTNAQNIAAQQQQQTIQQQQAKLAALQSIAGTGSSGINGGIGTSSGLGGFAQQQQAQMNANVSNGTLQDQAKSYLNGPQGSQVINNLSPEQRTAIDQATGGWNKDAVKWVQLANDAIETNLSGANTTLAQDQSTYNTGNSDLRNAILQRLGQTGQ